MKKDIESSHSIKQLFAKPLPQTLNLIRRPTRTLYFVETKYEKSCFNMITRYLFKKTCVASNTMNHDIIVWIGALILD